MFIGSPFYLGTVKHIQDTLTSGYICQKIRYPVLLIRKCDMSSPINFSYGYKFWPYYFPSKACRRSEKTTFCPFISSSLKIWFTKFCGNLCRETNFKIVICCRGHTHLHLGVYLIFCFKVFAIAPHLCRDESAEARNDFTFDM